MPEKIYVLGPIYTRYVGVFEWEQLYRLMRETFVRTGFRWHEGKYKAKPWNALGDEKEIKWECRRKVTEYFKDIVKVHIYIVDFATFDVQTPEGVKKMNSGRLQIKFDATVLADYWGDFEKNKFWKSMRTFLNNQVLKKDIDFKHDTRLYNEIYEIQTKIKKFLNMYASYNAHK